MGIYLHELLAKSSWNLFVWRIPPCWHLPERHISIHMSLRVTVGDFILFQLRFILCVQSAVMKHWCMLLWFIHLHEKKSVCMCGWVGVGVEVMGWGGGCMRHYVMACWRTGCKTLFEPLVSKSNGPWFCWRSIITSLKGQGKTLQSWWVSGVGGREFEKAHWLRSSSVGYVTLQTLLGLPSWCYAMYAIKSLRVSDLLLSCSDLT